jgi:hypothetical protein
MICLAIALIIEKILLMNNSLDFIEGFLFGLSIVLKIYYIYYIYLIARKENKIISIRM